MTKKSNTYNESIKEIEKILRQIEQDELDVDELSEKVTRVSQLINVCKEKLHKTETEVNKIIKEMDEDK